MVGVDSGNCMGAEVECCATENRPREVPLEAGVVLEQRIEGGAVVLMHAGCKETHKAWEDMVRHAVRLWAQGGSVLLPKWAMRCTDPCCSMESTICAFARECWLRLLTRYRAGTQFGVDEGVQSDVPFGLRQKIFRH